MNVKQFIRILATVTAVLLTASYAVAQGNSGGHGNGGGGGGGGGAGQNGGGVIYFRHAAPLGYFDLYTMNDDGSGVELVADFPRTPGGEPSHGLHADKRWIAQRQSVPGEYYPDGDRRQEFVALSDAGDIVPLQIEADLDPIEQPRWVDGDGFLSWVGRRWDTDPESPTYGEVVEGGLYVTPLEFDIDGNVAGIGGPSSLLVSRDLVDGLPDITSHDWSPDGSAFVFDTRSRDVIIFDLVTETFDVVISDAIGAFATLVPGRRQTDDDVFRRQLGRRRGHEHRRLRAKETGEIRDRFTPRSGRVVANGQSSRLFASRLYAERLLHRAGQV